MKSVVINDLHVPFEDKTAVKLVLSFIKREKPEIVILDGDIADFYKVSYYDKDPCRLETLQDELDLVVKFLRELRKASGTAKIIYIQGNHEDRLRRYLWNVGKDISSLRCLKLNQLLEFKELGIQYYEKGYRLGKLYITHGSIVRKHSGYSAKAEYEKYGCSGISGHCFSDDTEILTDSGWVYGMSLTNEYRVATIDKATRKFQFNDINGYYKYDHFKTMVHVKSTTTDLLVTPDHRLIFDKRNGQQVEMTAAEAMEYNGRMRFYSCGFNGGYIPCDEYKLRLIVNIAADGSVDGNSIRWHLSKKRKIEHLKHILDTLNLPYTHHIQSSGTTKIRVKISDMLNLGCAISYYCASLNNGEKHLPIWFAGLGSEEARVVLNEYSITDGCKNSGAVNSYQICSSKEHEIDTLQSLFVSNGLRATKNRGDCFTLTVNTRTETNIEKKNFSLQPYDGSVWCVSVDNGTVIVRRNGKVSISCNTHRDGKYTVRHMSGHFAWWENYCLCDLEPEYIEGIANWTQGFSVVTTIGNRQYVEQIPIINGTYIYGGKLYGLQ